MNDTHEHDTDTDALDEFEDIDNTETHNKGQGDPVTKRVTRVDSHCAHPVEAKPVRARAVPEVAKTGR